MRIQCSEAHLCGSRTYDEPNYRFHFLFDEVRALLSVSSTAPPSSSINLSTDHTTAKETALGSELERPERRPYRPSAYIASFFRQAWLRASASPSQSSLSRSQQRSPSPSTPNRSTVKPSTPGKLVKKWAKASLPLFRAFKHLWHESRVPRLSYPNPNLMLALFGRRSWIQSNQMNSTCGTLINF